MLQGDFAKGHGLGNDYVVLEEERLGFPLTPERVRLLCHRHLGLGSDGILALSRQGDRFRVRIWNPDGSEAERSGNGLRIAAKFLSDHGYTKERIFPIGTAAGPVTTEVYRRDGRVHAVRLEMGRAVVDETIRKLSVEGAEVDVTVVSVGNPHCVIFGEPLTRERLFAIGPQVERHARFPDRINVQLVVPETRARIKALVWERGAGHTLASGTSACAVAAACVARGLVDGTVTVSMEGGELDVAVAPDRSIVMKGPVEEVYVGTLSPDLRRQLLECP